MKTLDFFTGLLTGPAMVTDLIDLLRREDREFPETEKAYLAAVQALRVQLPPDFTPSLDACLADLERDIRDRMIYAGYQGFLLNLENFRHPLDPNFSWLNHLEERMAHRPVYEESLIDTLYNALLQDMEALYDAISEYHVFLECFGPKLAYYEGFLLADSILPLVEPGYRVGLTQTLAFTASLKSYLGFLPV